MARSPGSPLSVRKRCGQRAREHGAHQRERLGTPRATGIAGVVFAILMATAIVLMRLALPGGAGAAGISVDAGQRSAVRTAPALLPFAGIAFLWFMEALREQAGEGEDRFVSTVFPGSGLVFVAALSAVPRRRGPCSPRAAALLVRPPFRLHPPDHVQMRRAAVFVFTNSTIGRRLGVFPRPLVVLGHLVGLTLLVVGADVPWSELVFPVWALIVGLHVLRRRHPAGSRPAAPA
ncbi:hypothetical protein [Streptomyces sp. NPDC006527]|uniref:hypothetical protein n=1 Tax=Streptomyces sp. NPDC006527 TaxID=3364749 RepID=UPI0036953398